MDDQDLEHLVRLELGAEPLDVVREAAEQPVAPLPRAVVFENSAAECVLLRVGGVGAPEDVLGASVTCEQTMEALAPTLRRILAA